MAGDVMNILYYLKIEGSAGYSDNNDGTYLGTVEDQESRMVTDYELLDALKLQKIDELKLACSEAIQTGFYSSAIGTPHKYDSALPQDQTNLVGAKIAGVDMNFTCTDEDGVKTERFHTASQIEQVFIAGMVHIQTQKAHFYSKITALNNATTLVEVNNVTW